MLSADPDGPHDCPSPEIMCGIEDRGKHHDPVLHYCRIPGTELPEHDIGVGYNEDWTPVGDGSLLDPPTGMGRGALLAFLSSALHVCLQPRTRRMSITTTVAFNKGLLDEGIWRHEIALYTMLNSKVGCKLES